MKVKPSWTKARKAWKQVIVGERKCLYCKKTFGIRRGSLRQKFCSSACVHKSNIKKKNKRPCPVCKKSFWTKKKTQKTCSLACGGIYRGRKAKRKYTKIQKVPINIRGEYCQGGNNE